MAKNFIQLCESTTSRYTRGGFLVGDYIKFVNGFKEHEPYKRLAQNVRDIIDQMIESGLHVRVVGINDVNPTRYPGSADTESGEVTLRIALDNGGGRFTHYTTLPTCCAKPIDYYPNLAPMPDNVVRPNGEVIKPVEYKRVDSNKEAEDQQTKADGGNKKKVKIDLSLPEKNTKIKSSPAKDAESPAGASTVIDYLKYMLGH